MIVRVSKVKDPSIPSPWIDPEPFMLGRQYFAHAVGVDEHGDASVCVREPSMDPIFPYFYSVRFLEFVDHRIPEGYELLVQDDRFQRVLIAPPFWTRDPAFYEKLSNAHKDETGGVVKMFREHIERVRQSLNDDSVVV